MPRKGQPGPDHSPETRKLISDKVKEAYRSGKLIHWSKKYPEHPFMKGFTGKHTEETKALISKNRTGKGLRNTAGFKPNHKPWNKGKSHNVHTPEWREKVSKAQSGPNHWNWQGGISLINRAMRSTRFHKDWAKAVHQKCNWTCQECGYKGRQIVAHHIKPWFANFSLRFDVSNGVTLCRSCHCAYHKPRTGTGKSPSPN